MTPTPAFRPWRVAKTVLLTVGALAAIGLAVRTTSVARVSVGGSRGNPVSPAARAPLAIDSRRQQLIGVRTAPVIRDSLGQTIRTFGSVHEDERRLIDINLKMDGWIKELYVSSVGQHVTAGQPLLSVYSPDLDSLEANYLAALASREKAPLTQSTDGSELTDRLVTSSRQRLKQWDVAEPELQALERNRQLPPAVTFRSPVTGVVLARDAIRGMHVQAGHSLYQIADLSIVLVEADIRETDASLVENAGHAEVTVDAWPKRRFDGRVLTTYPYIAERTRTIRVRLEVANPGRELKPGMLATVELKGMKRPGLLVPADAVVNSGTAQVVFVAQGDGHFEPRPVSVGETIDGKTLILSGLRENEAVATRAAFFLDSESRMATALEDFAGTRDNQTASTAPHPIVFALTISPDPPRTGDNLVEVRLTSADGSPVMDAELDVRVSMAAMPAMGMPAMRSHAGLSHIAAGLYRGTVPISMAGTWNVTVTAVRQGHRIGTHESTLLAH